MRHLTDEQRNLTGQQTAALNQQRSQRPNMQDLPTAFDNIQQARQSGDPSLMPDSFYDHVYERVYVQLLDSAGNPSGNYRALDTIDPNPANRTYKTVED